MSCVAEPQDAAAAAAAATVASETRPNAVREAAALSPEAYEEEHVHSVYESIAGHFSSTRHKPWPFVASFLRERVAAGAVGLDVGCGNGKYLGVRGSGGGGGDGGGTGTGTAGESSSSSQDVHMIGSDRSGSLVRIARGRGFDVAVADGLALPFRPGRADFALCIAVVHHLSTRARRVDALRRLLECVRPDGGQVLVYVWALEQSASRRGWDARSEQDQLVPWVVKANHKRDLDNNHNKNHNDNKTKTKAKAKKGKEGGDGSGGGVPEKVENPGQDQDQDQGRDQGQGQSQGRGQGEGGESAVRGDTTYERFYHLYREGELEEDMRAAGGKILESGYERDNWWVIGGPGEEKP